MLFTDGATPLSGFSPVMGPPPNLKSKLLKSPNLDSKFNNNQEMLLLKWLIKLFVTSLKLLAQTSHQNKKITSTRLLSKTGLKITI